MRKLSESVWMDIHRRSNGDQERKEDLMPTCLGISIPLENKDCRYDDLIEVFLREGEDLEVGICKLNDMNWSSDELSNVVKGVAPFNYLIYKGGHGTDLVANFNTYEEFLDCNDYYG